MTSPANDPAEASNAPAMPRRLGKYELLRKLATGGMAEIYLARVSGIEGFEKIVVVKRILSQFAANKEFVQLFLDEARLAATLHHPNIAQVYDVGIVGGQYFFAMEHVHGEDLRSILKAVTAKGTDVPLDVGLSIILGVCAGLHYAHEKTGFDGKPLGIIHRDVSPSNVLVTYDGCPKMVDFGIAKAATSSVETRAGSIRGKLSYLSPEQCRCEPLDRRSDIFSIGIVLYELTTCRKLYAGKGDFETMKRIVETPAPPPSTRRPGYPMELQRIALKALARRREERYQTAQELQLDLEAFAREQKLAVSSVTMARFMETLFADKIAAWREAQLQGKGLGEHLAASIGTGDVGSGSDPSGVSSLEPDSQERLPTGTGAPGTARPTARVPAVTLPEMLPQPGRSRVPLYLLAGIALVAIGLGVAVGLKPGGGATGVASPAASADQVDVQVITEPPGATVVLDGKRQTLLTPQIYQVSRRSALALRLEMDGYKPFEDKVAIGRDERVKVVRAKLTALKLPGGKLEVRSNAKHATWKLDGEVVGDGSGVLSLPNVTPGTHQVAVEARGFESRSEVVEIAPRGFAQLVWDLKASGRRTGRPSRGTSKKPRPGSSGDLDGIGGWPPQ